MNIEVLWELRKFLLYCFLGILLGILLDIFRILRRTFKTSDFMTFIEDILLGVISAILILKMFFEVNKGELRLYSFLGIILGFIIYLKIFSKLIIKVNVKILLCIKKIIYKIILIILSPIKKVKNKIIDIKLFKMQNNRINKKNKKDFSK